MDCKIYSLNCPITGAPKYIGKTIKPLSYRLNIHMHPHGRSKKNSWIKSLIANGLKPEIVEIDCVSRIEENFWERHYISLYKSWGFDLKNMTDGGDGGHIQRSLLKWKIVMIGDDNPSKRPDVRRKISRSKMGDLNPSKRKDVKDKLSKIASKRVRNPIVQLSKQGEFIKRWDRQTDAATELNIHKDNIFSVVKGLTNTAGGFKWMYESQWINRINSFQYK